MIPVLSRGGEGIPITGKAAIFLISQLTHGKLGSGFHLFLGPVVDPDHTTQSIPTTILEESSSAGTRIIFLILRRDQLTGPRPTLSSASRFCVLEGRMDGMY